MEVEILRTLQRVLDTMKDQHDAIRALEDHAWGPSRTFSDGIKDRIERMEEEVRRLESLCGVQEP